MANHVSNPLPVNALAALISMDLSNPGSQVYVGARGTPRHQQDNLLVYVVAPVAGGIIFVTLVGLLVFLNMARRKRSQAGTYNPQKQVSNHVDELIRG